MGSTGSAAAVRRSVMLPFVRHPVVWCVLAAVLVDLGVIAAAAAIVLSNPTSSLTLVAIPATAAVTLATGMVLAGLILSPGVSRTPVERSRA